MRDANAVWDRVLDQFRGGFGDEPDLRCATDRAALLDLMEIEIRGKIEAEIAQKFTAATARLNGVTT